MTPGEAISVAGDKLRDDILGWCFNCQLEVDWGGDNAHTVVDHDSSCTGDSCCGGVPVPCGPVWPGLRVRDQAELERLAPELLRVDAPGHWVEWVPGLGRLDLSQAQKPACADTFGYCWCGAHARTHQVRIDWRIRWLRIAADPVGLCVDIAAVRAVVRDARAAGVPVWIEALGPHVVNSSNEIGPWPVVNDSDADTEMDMTDFADWPEDLQCRELPS